MNGVLIAIAGILILASILFAYRARKVIQTLESAVAVGYLGGIMDCFALVLLYRALV